MIKIEKYKAKSLYDYNSSLEEICAGDYVEGYYAFLNGAHVIITQLCAESGGVGNGLIDYIVDIDEKTLSLLKTDIK